MLYSIRHPAVFVILAASFLVSIACRGLVQRAFLGRRRGPRRLSPSSGSSVRSLFDPYGIVGEIIGGVGWGSTIVPSPVARYAAAGARHGRFVAAVLAGPLTQVAMGVGALIGYRVLGGPAFLLQHISVLDTLHGRGIDLGFELTADFGRFALLLFGIESLGLGILALLPMPPLDGGRVLFQVAPRTPGWQRLGYRLIEDNWGVAIVLVLLLIPFGIGVLTVIVSAIETPIIGLIGS